MTLTPNQRRRIGAKVEHELHDLARQARAAIETGTYDEAIEAGDPVLAAVRVSPKEFLKLEDPADVPEAR